MIKQQTQAEKATERDGTDSKATDNVEPRTRRALEEFMTVLPTHGAADDRRHAYAVIGQHERSPEDRDEDYYIVDMNYGTCTCGDHMKRQRSCKHIRRVEILTGRRAVTPAIQEQVSPADNIGEFIDTDIRFVMPDGGVVEESEDDDDDDDDDTENVSTDGGSDVQVSPPIWTEPKLEVDRYGNPTGDHYVRCQDCGIEVLEGQESRTAHRAGCIMTPTTEEQ